MFGLGKGKAEINLDKYNFLAGETINGKLSINVKKPTKAKSVYVRLYAEQKTSNFSNNSTNIQKVFDFRQPLDGQKEYSGNYEYNFQIKIPSNIINLNNPLGTALKSVQFLTGKSSQIKWYVKAGLDIPMGIDISKKVQINVA